MINHLQIRGFTLVELIISLIILTTLAVSGISFYHFPSRDHLKLVSEDIISNLRFARLSAIQANEIVIVDSENWNKGFHIRYSSSPNLLRNIHFNRLKIEPILFNSQSSIQFTPDGRCLNNGRLFIKDCLNNQVSIEIILNISGRIRSETVTYS